MLFQALISFRALNLKLETSLTRIHLTNAQAVQVFMGSIQSDSKFKFTHLVCGWLIKKYSCESGSVFGLQRVFLFFGGGFPQETMFLQLQIQTDSHNTHLKRRRGPVQYKFSAVPHLELHVTVQTKPVVACAVSWCTGRATSDRTLSRHIWLKVKDHF